MNSSPNHDSCKPLAPQRGSVTILLVLLLPAVVLVVGLAIDSAQMLQQRRQLQARADSAAIAAAYQIFRGYTQTAQQAALADAAAQGLGPDSGASLTLFVPPASGPHAGKPWHAQVQVRQPVSLLFLDWLGIADPTLEAVATAGWVLRAPCVLALDGQVLAAVLIDKKAHLQAVDCGVQVNSGAATALTVERDAVLSATRIKVTGGTSLGSGAVVTPQPLTQQPVMDDPLMALAEPTPDTCLATGLRINDVQTLQPGTYCDGIEIKNKGKVTLLPGLYILFGGGLRVAKGATLQGSGITFFNTSSGTWSHDIVEMDVQASVQLSAPSTGPWAGILLFETRSVPTNVYTHAVGISATSALTGFLYAPRSGVSLTGTKLGFANASADYLGVIASQLVISDRLQFQLPPNRVPLGPWHALRWTQ